MLALWRLGPLTLAYAEPWALELLRQFAERIQAARSGAEFLLRSQPDEQYGQGQLPDEQLLCDCQDCVDRQRELVRAWAAVSA